MKSIALATVASILAISAAHATTITFSPGPTNSSIFAGLPYNSGGTENPSGAFSSEGWNFSSMVIARGTTAGIYVAPVGLSATTNYGVVLGGQTETVTIASGNSKQTTLSIDWSSIDPGNKLCTNAGFCETGAQLLALGAPHSTQVTFSGLSAFSDFTLTSPYDSFEFVVKSPQGFVSDSRMMVMGAAVPEIPGWAMLMAGFAGLGFVGWRKAVRT